MLLELFVGFKNIYMENSISHIIDIVYQTCLKKFNSIRLSPLVDRKVS